MLPAAAILRRPSTLPLEGTLCVLLLQQVLPLDAGAPNPAALPCLAGCTQVACPLDGYSFFNKQPEMPPAVCLAFLPFALLAD